MFVKEMGKCPETVVLVVCIAAMILLSMKIFSKQVNSIFGEEVFE